ncbi:MAG: tyrosine-protein phosphatase [Candidatus Nanopelagicales bacterium]
MSSNRAAPSDRAGSGHESRPGAAAVEHDLAELLAAVPNFRDAGGMAAGTGRRFREGFVFRSGQLVALTSAARQAISSLGIGMAVDLRTQAERVAQPDSLPTSVRVEIADVLADNPGSGAAKLAALANSAPDALPIEAINAAIGNGRAAGLMIGSYRGFVALDSAKLAYRTFVSAVAHADSPLIFYCTAGKDRTGWAAAMLQLFAGVSQQDVMDGYLASNDKIGAEFDPMIDKFGAAGVDVAAMRALVEVRGEYLEAAMDSMTSSYGEVGRYFEDGLGLRASELSALESRLLD